MQIRMKKITRWNGDVLKPGATIEVANVTGERWLRTGIAELAAEKAAPPQAAPAAPAPKESDDKEDTGNAPAAGGKPDSGADEPTMNDLRKTAKEKGITVKVGTSKKQLIDIINATDARRNGD